LTRDINGWTGYRMKPVKIFIFYIFLPASALSISFILMNKAGIFSHFIENHNLMFSLIFTFSIAHFTIASMSLSFHRFHTHRGIILHPLIDIPMQMILWLVTSMNKMDWVAVHRVHHKFSDTPKDPHGPISRGFWQSLLLGGAHYHMAKKNPDVILEREKIAANRIEIFFHANPLMGPFIMTSCMILSFGFYYGFLFSAVNFIISPALGVGGVNTLAHWWGYKNHASHDNSRNIGFLFPLNFLICGELDHNNHHGHQASCSFRHKWYEFDIGYVYVRLLKFLRLAKIKFAFTPLSMKEELSVKWIKTLERHETLKRKWQNLADEFNMNKAQIVETITASIINRRIKLEKPFRDFKKEVLRMIKIQYQHSNSEV